MSNTNKNFVPSSHISIIRKYNITSDNKGKIITILYMLQEIYTCEYDTNTNMPINKHILNLYLN